MSEELITSFSGGDLKVDVRIADDNTIYNAVSGRVFSVGVGSGGAFTVESDQIYGKTIHFNKSWIYDENALAQSPKGRDFVVEAVLRRVNSYALPLRMGSIVGYYKGASLFLPDGQVIGNSAGSAWQNIYIHPSPYPPGIAATDWVRYKAWKALGKFHATINEYSPYSPETIAALDTYFEDVPRGLVIGDNVYSPACNWVLASLKFYVND